MNLLTSILSLVGSGASAYIMARNLRDSATRPNMLAGLQLAESGAVPLLETLSRRAATEGDAWLAERLQKHANDERRHGQIFASGLRNLNKQVIDVEELRQRSADRKNRSPFFDAYFEGYTAEDLKAENITWSVFMGSTYILELDASKDFMLMARSLPDDPQSMNLQKGIMSIARDEEGHAAYLYEAMTRRFSYGQVTRLVDEWRERKVNALMAMVTDMIQRNGEVQSLARDGVPPEMQESQTPAAVESLEPAA